MKQMQNRKRVLFIEKAIQNKAWPGSVLLGSKDGKIFIHEASGFHTYDKKEK